MLPRDRSRSAGVGSNALPWGNYSTTCIDPTDPRRLWTYQEYADSATDGQWCTAWASFQLDPTSAGRGKRSDEGRQE